MQLRKVLKDLMKIHGHNTRTLAETTGIAEGTLKTWLAGSNPRNLSDLRTVARHLNVSFEYLIFGEETDSDVAQKTPESNHHTFEGWLRIRIEKIHRQDISEFEKLIVIKEKN